MREYEIDRASNFVELQFYRVGLVTRFMTMKGRERKGLSKWNVDEMDFSFFFPALINRKEIRTIDSLQRILVKTTRGSRAGVGQKW